jgi:hypothetical protein
VAQKLIKTKVKKQNKINTVWAKMPHRSMLKVMKVDSIHSTMATQLKLHRYIKITPRVPLCILQMYISLFYLYSSPTWKSSFLFFSVTSAFFTRFTFTVGIQKALKVKQSNVIVLLLQEAGLGCIKELYNVQSTCSFRIIFTRARLKYHNFLTLQSSVHSTITTSSTYYPY